MTSPATAPPTPAPKPSTTPKINPSLFVAEDPAQHSELANLGSQTDVTMGDLALDKGEPSKGNDPSTEVFADNLLSNPGIAKLGITRKTAEEIQKLAQQCLESRNITIEEDAQEAEDVKLLELLDQVRLRDDMLKASVAPPPPVIPLTLAEKVSSEVNTSLKMLTHEHYVSRNLTFSFTLFHIISSSPQA